MARKTTSVQKVVPVRNRVPQSQESREDAQERSEVMATQVKEQQRKANDPISAPLDYGQWVRDQSPTQVFGMQVITDLKGDVSKIPNYRFKRWYFRSDMRIVVDTFMTQGEYNSADVEGRRAMCKKYGVRYAALGPNHAIMPHGDKTLRAKFPSQVEQLGLA